MSHHLSLSSISLITQTKHDPFQLSQSKINCEKQEKIVTDKISHILLKTYNIYITNVLSASLTPSTAGSRQLAHFPVQTKGNTVCFHQSAEYLQRP